MKITQEEAELKFLFKYKGRVSMHSIKQIVNYWYNHVKPRKLFITAVLSNDLRATMTTMDQVNWPRHIREIRGMVYFIARDLPKECNGSAEIVQRWLDARATTKDN